MCTNERCEHDSCINVSLVSLLVMGELFLHSWHTLKIDKKDSVKRIVRFFCFCARGLFWWMVLQLTLAQTWRAVHSSLSLAGWVASISMMHFRRVILWQLMTINHHDAFWEGLTSYITQENVFFGPVECYDNHTREKWRFRDFSMDRFFHIQIIRWSVLMSRVDSCNKNGGKEHCFPPTGTPQRHIQIDAVGCRFYNNSSKDFQGLPEQIYVELRWNPRIYHAK